MSTRTLRGLAAGVGAAAILLAGAAGASASQDIPQPGPFEAEAEAEGYGDVTCNVQPLTGNQSALYLTEDVHGAWLEDGEINVLLVLKSANQYDRFWEPQYGGPDENVYESSTGKNITHTVLCRGTLVDDGEPTEEPTGDPTDEPTDEPTEDPTDGPTEDPTEPGDGDDDGDGVTPGDEDEQATGPAVETDGPATPSGPNMGLMGGAALLLGGAGAAGWAMRRRAGEH